MFLNFILFVNDGFYDIVFFEFGEVIWVIYENEIKIKIEFEI